MADLLFHMLSDINASQVKPIDTPFIGKLITYVRHYDIGDAPNESSPNLLHQSLLRPATLATSLGTTLTHTPITCDTSNNVATKSKFVATTPNGRYRKGML
jgi:hypothetical protein